MNFSGVSNRSVVGRIARLPLRLIPKKTVVRILQGELRGYKWVVGAGSHGFWLGSYEFEQQKVIAREVPVGGIVWDVGANVGFYTLLASKKAKHVYAFEPFPSNAAKLRRHLELNGIKNVTVVETAVSDRDGECTFTNTETSTMNHLSDSGDGLRVRVSTLDSVDLPRPDFIKMDIEGEEVKALRGASRLLSQTRPKIFLSVHHVHITNELHDQCCAILSQHGYSLQHIQHDEILATWSDNPAV